jgi:hypothetical protein
MSAVMDQRGGRPRRQRIKAGTIELLCRLKRDVYPDFSLRHFCEHVTEKHGVKVSYNWLRLMLPARSLRCRRRTAGGRGRPDCDLRVCADAHDADRSTDDGSEQSSGTPATQKPLLS